MKITSNFHNNYRPRNLGIVTETIIIILFVLLNICNMNVVFSLVLPSSKQVGRSLLLSSSSSLCHRFQYNIKYNNGNNYNNNLFKFSSFTRLAASERSDPPPDFTIVNDDSNNNNNDNVASFDSNKSERVESIKVNNDDDWYKDQTTTTTTGYNNLNRPSSRGKVNEGDNNDSAGVVSDRRTPSWMDRNVQFSEQQQQSPNNQRNSDPDGRNFRNKERRSNDFEPERRSNNNFRDNKPQRRDFDPEQRRSSSFRNDDRPQRRGESSSRNPNDRSRSSTNNYNRDSDGDSSRNFRQDFRGTRVFVKGLPPSATWQTLKDHFRDAVPNSNVIYASVSMDPKTRINKDYGIVQYETNEMAQNAIKNMRQYPMDGFTLYVREDVQESNNDKDGSQQRSVGGNNNRRNNYEDNAGGGRDYDDDFDGSTENKRGPTPPSRWKCANTEDDINNFIDNNDKNSILKILRARDQARRRKNYEASDAMREQLRNEFGVHIDDRLTMWWIMTNDGRDNKPPSLIQEMKGEGGWDRDKKQVHQDWKQLPSTAEYDACVDSDLVNGLLRQRDIARRAKDFNTADTLLEQARNSPDGDLCLRIHDESRTWRIWTDEPPSYARKGARSNNNYNDEGDDNDNDEVFNNNQEEDNSSDYETLTPAEQCLRLVEELAPEKIDEVKQLLEKFPGREWNILKKIKQSYSK